VVDGAEARGWGRHLVLPAVGDGLVLQLRLLGAAHLEVDGLAQELHHLRMREAAPRGGVVVDLVRRQSGGKILPVQALRAADKDGVGHCCLREVFASLRIPVLG